MSEGADLTCVPHSSGRGRALVLGFGNRDRGDDGVAFDVLHALCRRFGREPLTEEDTGIIHGGAPADLVFLPQLAPEWLDLAAPYGVLIFIDAHVNAPTALECSPVTADGGPAALAHHMTPAMFLALLQALCGSHPDAHLISICGHEFGFCQGLSPETHAQVAPAVERVLGLLDATAKPM